MDNIIYHNNVFKNIDILRKYFLLKYSINQYINSIQVLYVHNEIFLESNSLHNFDIFKLLTNSLYVDKIYKTYHNKKEFRYDYYQILSFNNLIKYFKRNFFNMSDITLNDIKILYDFFKYTDNGEFRKHNIFIGNNIFTSHENIEKELKIFIYELNKMKNVHPICKAIFAHVQLYKISPFCYHNKKISRALMNLILVKYGYPPIVINKKNKNIYLYVLDKCLNDINWSALHIFISYALENTINYFLFNIK